MRLEDDRKALIEEVKKHYRFYGLEVDILENIGPDGYNYFIDLHRVTIHPDSKISDSLKNQFTDPLTGIFSSEFWKQETAEKEALRHKISELEKYKTYYEMESQLRRASAK